MLFGKIGNGKIINRFLQDSRLSHKKRQDIDNIPTGATLADAAVVVEMSEAIVKPDFHIQCKMVEATSPQTQTTLSEIARLSLL